MVRELFLFVFIYCVLIHSAQTFFYVNLINRMKNKSHDSFLHMCLTEEKSFIL